jgi:hypothetical protein
MVQDKLLMAKMSAQEAEEKRTQERLLKEQQVEKRMKEFELKQK